MASICCSESAVGGVTVDEDADRLDAARCTRPVELRVEPPNPESSESSAIPKMAAISALAASISDSAMLSAGVVRGCDDKLRTPRWNRSCSPMEQAKANGIAPLHKATRTAETQLPRSKEAANIFEDCLNRSADRKRTDSEQTLLLTLRQQSHQACAAHGCTAGTRCIHSDRRSVAVVASCAAFCWPDRC